MGGGLTREFCINESCTMGAIWSSRSEGMVAGRKRVTRTVGGDAWFSVGAVKRGLCLRTGRKAIGFAGGRSAFGNLGVLGVVAGSCVVAGARSNLAGDALQPALRIADRQATWLGAPVGSIM